LPRPAFARTWDALITRLPEKKACRAMVALLALAHDHGCEADLAAALDSLLDASRLPDAEELRRRFAPRTGEAPAVVVVLPAVAATTP
jgi:hypothetical protein